MRMKPIIALLIAVSIAVVSTVAAFFLYAGKEMPQEPATSQEPQITINQIIGEAVMIYASSPYHRYSDDELHKYFISEIADEILKIYEPINDPNEEKSLEFEEQPLPVMGSVWITLEDGQYSVKLQFGEVFYNYRLTIAPNRIITKITDGGITFE